MARVRYFNGAATSAILNFGVFTDDSITAFSPTRIEVTGRDGQKFVMTGSGFSIDFDTQEVTGTITRVEWLDPDGGLLSIVDQIAYSAQRAYNAVTYEPEPGEPFGIEALVLDILAGDDVITGAAEGIGGYYADQGYSFNRIYVGTGNDTVKGGPGPERLQIGDGGTVDFDGAGGIDDVDYLFGSFEGTRGIDADLITGRIVNPFGGIDRIVRVENILGTIFDDIIRGTNGANLVDSGAGGRDHLFGRGGADRLQVFFDLPVTGIDDILDGGAGADMLAPGIGADRIIGGAGIDIVIYARENDDPSEIVVDLINPDNNKGNHANDIISGIEGFEVSWGTTSDTTISFTGTAGANSFISRLNAVDRLLGFGGNDTLDGGNSKDLLRSGDGNDVLFGGDAGDIVDGGSGFDIATYRDPNIVRIDLLKPDTNQGEALGDTYLGIEAFDSLHLYLGNNLANVASRVNNANGRGGNDLLSGTDGNNALSGGNGNDRIDGGDRADTLNGGAGNDRLMGGSASTLATSVPDIIAGGAGSDVIIGGPGIDSMSGGGGGDVFIFASIAETGLPGDFTEQSRDRIADFQLGFDTLRIAKAGFTGLQDAFGFVAGADPVATANTGTFLFDTDDGRLFYDTDGKGPRGAFLLMTLEDTIQLSRAAFDIV